MPMHMVIENMDGRFARFLITPTREITENDLTYLPYYRAIGRSAEEAKGYMYSMYGFTKEEN